jgi:hypothetical protein
MRVGRATGRLYHGGTLDATNGQRASVYSSISLPAIWPGEPLGRLPGDLMEGKTVLERPSTFDGSGSARDYAAISRMQMTQIPNVNVARTAIRMTCASS